MSLTFGKLKSVLLFLDIAHYKCWSTGKSLVFVDEWLMPRSCYNKVMTVCADRATSCVKWQMVWKSFGAINQCYSFSRTSLWGSRHLVNHLMSTSMWLSVPYREIFHPSSHILSLLSGSVVSDLRRASPPARSQCVASHYTATCFRLTKWYICSWNQGNHARSSQLL